MRDGRSRPGLAEQARGGPIALETTFGRYLLLQRLGEGGMAEVFQAKSFGVEGFEKVLVIKRILPALATIQRFVDMFVHEAKLAVRLSHANIVQVFDLGKVEHGSGAPASYFIAMEYVPGLDLATLLAQRRRQKQPVPIGLAVHVISEVAKALDHAHRRRDDQGRPLGIVHRDISPQNILLSWEGEVKVTDFGIAKARTQLDEDDEEEAGSRRIKGKLAYMSPEQARGEEVDERSDLFSLGVVFYEMLAGQNPFAAKAASETLRRIAAGEVPPLSVQRVDVPEPIAAIVAQLLARDPKDRTSDAGRLHEALLGWRYAAGERFSTRELADYLEPLHGTGDRATVEAALADDETRTHETTPVEVPQGRSAVRGDTRDEGMGTLELAGRREVSALVLGMSTQSITQMTTETGSRLADIVARWGGRVTENEPTHLVALFGLADADGRDAEAAVRAGLHALRARGVESAAVHAGRVLVDAQGQLVKDERVSSLVATAQALSRLADGRVVVSTIAARLVRGAFAAEELPSDRTRPAPSEGAWLVGTARSSGAQGRFVGRHRELRRVGEILARASKRSPRIAAIVGDKGIGKSRLLSEVQRRLVKGGYDVGFHLASCPKNGADLPWSGLTAMLQSLCGVNEGDEPERIREVRPRLRALGLRDDEADRVLERLGVRDDSDAFSRASLDVIFAHMVQRLSDDRVHVFAWDDAQAMDPQSRDAIVAAATRNGAGEPSRARAMFVLSTREAPTALLAEHEATEVVELAELAEDESAKLVAYRLGARILPPDLLALCRERAGGHPLFLEELLRELLDAAAVSVLSGVVATRLDGATAIPRSLRALIAERVNRLDPVERRLLHAAAVIGEPVPGDVLAHLAGISSVRIDRLVEGVADRPRAPGAPTLADFLRSRGPHVFAFVSRLYGEIVIEGIPPEAHAQLHATVAEAFIAVSPNEGAGEAPRIAQHLYEAGDRHRAATYYARAASQQLLGGRRDEGIRSSLRALELADLAARTPDEVLGWLERLSDAVFAMRSAPPLDDAVTRAIKRIDEAGAPRARAVARLAAARAFGSLNQFERSFELIATCIALAGDSPDVLVRAHGIELELAARAGDFSRAQKSAEALEGHSLPEDPILWLGIAFVRAATGDRDAARAASARAESIPTDPADLFLGVTRHRRFGLVHAYLRDFAAARDEQVHSVELARAAGARFELAAGLHDLGDTQKRLGDLPRAYASFSESREICESAGHERLAASNRNFLAFLDGLRADDPQASIRLLEDAIGFAEHRGFVNDVVEGRFLLGDLLARRGRSADAKGVLTRALAEAERAHNSLLASDVKSVLQSIADAARLDPAVLDDSTDGGEKA
jgi:serine/threonine protein kinase/tetratricopeptide (TPR) repeat protein